MSRTDPQRAALRSVRLSWAPTYEEVWDPSDELHVDGLHTDAWEDLEDCLGDAAASTGACPTGLVITGNKGTGKTHLLSRFRGEVQRQGHYFVLLELLDATDFWRAALTSLRSSLLRPARDHQTQLAQLLWLLSDEAGLSRAHRREFSRDAVPTPEGLDALVTALGERRPRVRQYHGVLRALALLASPDTRLADLGSAFLDDIEVEETIAERRHWGLPPTGFSSLETVRAISAFMAETGATVFAVDQIDTLLAQTFATLGDGDGPAESGVVEQVGHGLMTLREGLYRTVTVAAMLPTAWDALRTRATASVADRFRVVGPLRALPNGALARSIIERRLGAAYRAREFTPPYPTWPVAPEAFATAVHHTPRDVLTRVDAHIRWCVSSRSVFELTTFADGAAPPAVASVPATFPLTTAATGRDAASPAPDSGAATGTGTDGGALARLDALLAELRSTARVGDASTDQRAADRRMPELLEAGLRAWTREHGPAGFAIERGGRQLSGRLRQSLAGGVEDEQHWSFRAIPSTNPIAVSHRLRDAVAAAGLVAGVDRRKLFLLRSGPWPGGAKTTALVTDTLDAGARVLDLDEAELATLDALARIILRAPEGLDEWLLARRPAHALRVFAGLPALGSDPGAGPASVAGRPIGSPAAAAGTGAEESGLRRSLASASTTRSVGALSEAAAGVLFAGAHPAPTPPLAPAPPAPLAPASPAPRSPIRIGLDNTGAPAMVELEQLRKHVAIFAGSGSGKTVLIRRLIEECALRGISAIVLDPNNDLSRLGDAWPRDPDGWWPGDAGRAQDYLAETEVLVWTPNRSTGRPLVFRPIPDFPALRVGMEGVGPQALEAIEGFDLAVAACVSSLQGHAGVGGQRAAQQRAILREALAAYGRRTPTVSLNGFIEFLRDWDSDRSALPSADKLAPHLADNLRAAMINNPMLGGTGSVADPQLLLTPSPGKRARVSVISLIGLPDEAQRQAFVSQLQLALFSWIKLNPAGDRPLGWLLVMDEAQQIAPSGPVTPSTESTLLLASQARKYGLGLVFATQSPTGLHNKIVGNSGTHFFGRLNAAVQIQAAKEIAAARGGTAAAIGTLTPGRFYLGTESGTGAVHSPMCLSHHPASPPTEDQVLAAARAPTT